MISNAPKRIWLQYFNEDGDCLPTEETTWCDVMQDDFDVEYIRVDLAQPQWQPISTAPKDGRPVMLLSPGGRVCVASYGEMAFVGTGWSVIVPCMGGTGRGSDTHIHFQEDQPTHWMPLPEPPKEEPDA